MFGSRYRSTGEQRENQRWRNKSSDKVHTSEDSFVGFIAVIRVTSRGRKGYGRAHCRPIEIRLICRISTRT
jgi:hypothetical protein